MRKLMTLLGTAVLLALVAPTHAVAAPSDVRLSITAHAQYISPTTVLIPVSVVCPPTSGTASVTVRIEQTDTGGTGTGFTTVMCTGRSQNAVVTVDGGPFTVGRALASGTAFAGGVSIDSDTRRIQIVV